MVNFSYLMIPIQTVNLNKLFLGTKLTRERGVTRKNTLRSPRPLSIGHSPRPFSSRPGDPMGPIALYLEIAGGSRSPLSNRVLASR